MSNRTESLSPVTNNDNEVEQTHYCARSPCNVSRGDTVDQDGLVKALNENQKESFTYSLS